MKKRDQSYHHGDLRAALLQAATEVIEEVGVASLSLREVARRAGVSHGAPAHHFRDKAGLLTELAILGFAAFATALEAARDGAGSDPHRRLGEVGCAYVRFAVQHPAHFDVMFRPGVVDEQDKRLVQASTASYQVLLGCVQQAVVGTEHDVNTAALRAWSMAHGFATLWLAGGPRLPDVAGQPDLEVLLAQIFLPEGGC